MNLPKDWTTRSVGEILGALPDGDKLLEQIVETLNSSNSNQQAVQKLKELFKPHAAALDKIGIADDYFAYVLVHWVLPRAAQKQQQTN